MPNAEPEMPTLLKLTLLSERARQDPGCQFITAADIDTDGDLDLVLAGDNAGHLYRNNADGTFAWEQSFSATDGYMAGLADLDHHGDLDIVFAGDDVRRIESRSSLCHGGCSHAAIEVEGPLADPASTCRMGSCPAGRQLGHRFLGNHRRGADRRG